MKKNILSFIVLLFSITLKAQSPVYVVNTSGPNLCDGSAYLVDSTQLFQSWEWVNASDNTIIQVGGYLNILCPGTYIVSTTAFDGIISTFTFTIGTGNGTDCSTLGLTVSQLQIGFDTLMNNGFLYASAYGGTLPYTYTWDNGQTGVYLDSLAEGPYQACVTDAIGCIACSNANVNFDPLIGSTLNIYPSTTNVSVEGACDGSVNIEVYGGVPPYTFIDINGVVTNQFVTGLCEGVYSTYVTDASGIAININYFIASPDNVIDNGGWNDTTTVILDTLTSPTLEDCIISYLTLDSAYISNINFVTLDSILVTWSIFDASGVIEIIESYNLENGMGLYEFIIQIFCPQRATDQYIIIKETRMLNGSSSALAENKLNDINMFPNPVQDVLTIAVGKNLSSIVTVTDITGKIIYNLTSSSELIKVDFNNLAKGQYVVNVTNNEQNITQKIIK